MKSEVKKVSLYCHTKQNRMTVIIGETALGSMIRRNVFTPPAPSIRAASSISFGIPLKNWRKI
ncbi:hypothetical protein D3C80_2138900 [compost metagenome]